jgi:hypothetical protein
MAMPVTVNEVLDRQVVLDLQCLDRVYPNAYVPGFGLPRVSPLKALWKCRGGDGVSMPGLLAAAHQLAHWPSPTMSGSRPMERFRVGARRVGARSVQHDKAVSEGAAPGPDRSSE